MGANSCGSCWRIRLAFAAIGLAGCTGGALLPEFLFGANGVQKQFERAGSPPLLFLAERQRRLAAAGAHGGEPEVSLFWQSVNDLDLHVIEPSGEHIFFAHRRSRTDGELDVDMNVWPTTRRPVEHVYWPTGSAPRGQYLIFVHHYKNHGAHDPSAFRVEVRSGGRIQAYTGATRYGDPMVPVAAFTVTGRPASWLSRLLKPGIVALIAISALWCALVASTLTLALLCGLRWIAPLPIRERAKWSIQIVWGGLAAGAAGQAICSVVAELCPSVSAAVCHMLGCAMLGIILGGWLGGRVPLLERRAALIVGGLAGAVGGWAFCLLGYGFMGRLAYAGLLGAAIGALICWHAASARNEEDTDASGKTARRTLGGSIRVSRGSARSMGRSSGSTRQAKKNVSSRSGGVRPKR